MKKILIIEDDPIVAHIYRTRLEKEAYSVETCADGQSGFYRVHEFCPDAMLLDLMLPKMNGIDILKKIRAQSKFASVPIVVFTNAYVPNMIQEAFSAGASQVFNKATLTPRQILDSLHLLLNGGKPTADPSLMGFSSSGSTPLGGKPGPDPMTSLAESPFQVDPSHGSPPPPANYNYTYDGPRPFSEPTNAPNPLRALQPLVNTDDSAFQAELHSAFVASKQDTLATLRKHLHDLTKAPDEASRDPHLHDLYRKVHALTGSAGIAGFVDIAQMTAALEVLLKELTEKPKNINASTLRTVAHSVDFLGELFKISEARVGELAPANILVVDDEILSRRAISYALEKANLKSVNVEDPAVALKMANEEPFDLIFLDVQMPGMDGFELCTKIRALATNKQTPIIFVTSLTDFKSRAKSSLSGGTDLIAKPFMFIELTVKALTLVLRNRLLPRRQAA
ncbi:MAG TPA: response regulator [Candidatus Saccharimonadales bacterium]|nr:response regulator [Candidatus Saccharimonadales bacterium]